MTPELNSRPPSAAPEETLDRRSQSGVGRYDARRCDQVSRRSEGGPRRNGSALGVETGRGDGAGSEQPGGWLYVRSPSQDQWGYVELAGQMVPQPVSFMVVTVPLPELPPLLPLA
jgi:hypothetical protein